MTVVILGEEIGWRGFLLPRVQELTDKRRAAVITGFAHGLFHLPLICIATTYDTGGSRWIVAPAAVVTITAGGVFYAWLRDRSGSIWPVAIAHNSVNTVFDMGATLVVAIVAGQPRVRRRRDRLRHPRRLRRDGGRDADAGEGLADAVGRSRHGRPERSSPSAETVPREALRVYRGAPLGIAARGKARR